MKDNQIKLNWIYVLVDACTIIVAYLFAYYLRFYIPFFTVALGSFYPMSKYMALLVYLVPLYLIIYYLFRFYTTKQEKRKLTELYSIVLSNIVGIALLLAILYFLKEINVSRKLLIIFFIINVILSVSSRLLLSYFVKVSRRKL